MDTLAKAGAFIPLIGLMHIYNRLEVLKEK